MSPTDFTFPSLPEVVALALIAWGLLAFACCRFARWLEKRLSMDP